MRPRYYKCTKYTKIPINIKENNVDQLLPYLYTIISGPENISRTKIQDVVNELRLRISNYKQDNKINSYRETKIKTYEECISLLENLLS